MVTTTIVAGKILRKNRKLLVLDEEDLPHAPPGSPHALGKKYTEEVSKVS